MKLHQVVAPRFARVGQLFIYGSLTYLLTSGLSLVSFPGLQYDEALFVNAATDGGFGSDSTSFVQERLFGVPVLLMNYIGALKAWLYTPIFALFGVSKFTIRAPMVLAFVFSVWLCLILVRRYSNFWIASVAALLFASEPVFALMARNDWGPVAIAGLLRVIAVFGVLKVVESGAARWFALTTGAMCLGVFNKLDFLLFAIPFIISLVVVFWKTWFFCWTTHRRRLIGSLVSLMLSYGLAYVYMYRPSQSINQTANGTLFERFRSRIDLIEATFEGRNLTSYMTGSSISSSSRLFVCVLVAVALVCLAEIRARLRGEPRELQQIEMAKPSSGRVLTFLILSSIGVLTTMALTPAVSGPHHVAVMWPMLPLILCFALANVLSHRRRKGLLGVTFLVGVILSIAIAFWTQTMVSKQMAAVFRNPELRSAIWSDEPETAATALAIDSRNEGAVVPVIIADWGIGNQVKAFIDKSVRESVIDGWPMFLNPTTFNPETVIPMEAQVERNFYLVTHTPGFQIADGTESSAEHLRLYCEEIGINSRPVFRGKQIVVDFISC